MLGAHYYPWYGKPAHSILGGGEWKSGYTDHPILGEYNSRDPAVIKQHIAWAKSAGLDFFVMEWTGPHTWEDITLKEYYLPASKAEEIKFCIFYDSYLALNKIGTLYSYNFNDRYTTAKSKGRKFLDDFEYLAETYFSDPRYLKIGNRPLAMIYVVRFFRNASSYLERLKVAMAKMGFSLFLVADIVFWTSPRSIKEALPILLREPSIQKMRGVYQAICHPFPSVLEEEFPPSRHFDAISGYNMYTEYRITSNFLKGVDREYQKFWDYARLHNLHFIPSFMPGYSDRNLRELTRPILQRKEGEFYKDFWKISKKYIDPELKMAFITTFNEWHEGTEIEPSQEYGSTYLELTKLFSDELKGGRL